MVTYSGWEILCYFAKLVAEGFMHIAHLFLVLDTALVTTASPLEY